MNFKREKRKDKGKWMVIVNNCVGVTLEYY